MARSGSDSLRPRDSRPPDFVQRGKVLILRKQFQEAVKVCRLGLLAHPTFVEGRLVLGMALMALTRYDEVLAEMRVALELDPQNPMAHLLKGEALFFKREVAQAKNALKRARELDPHSVKAKNLLDELAELGRGSNMPRLERTKTETKVYPAQRAQQVLPQRDPSAVLEMVESWAGGRIGQRQLGEQDKPGAGRELSESSPVLSAQELSGVPSSLQVRAVPRRPSPDLDGEDEDFTTAPFLPPNVKLDKAGPRLYEDWDEDTCADDDPPAMELHRPLLDDQTENGIYSGSGSEMARLEDTEPPEPLSAGQERLPGYFDSGEGALPTHRDPNAFDGEGGFSDPDDTSEQTADLHDTSFVEALLYPEDEEGTTETVTKDPLGLLEMDQAENVLDRELLDEEEEADRTQVDSEAPTPAQLFGDPRSSDKDLGQQLPSPRQDFDSTEALELEDSPARQHEGALEAQLAEEEDHVDQATVACVQDLDAGERSEQNVSLPQARQVRCVSGLEIESVRSPRQHRQMESEVSIELSVGDLQDLEGEESSEDLEGEMPPLPEDALQVSQSGRYDDDSDAEPTHFRGLDRHDAGSVDPLAPGLAGGDEQEPELATRVHFPSPAEPFVAAKALPRLDALSPTQQSVVDFRAPWDEQDPQRQESFADQDSQQGLAELPPAEEQNPFAISGDDLSEDLAEALPLSEQQQTAYRQRADRGQVPPQGSGLFDEQEGRLAPVYLDDCGDRLPPEHLEESGDFPQEHLEGGSELLPPRGLGQPGNHLPPEHLEDSDELASPHGLRDYGGELPPERLDSFGDELASPRGLRDYGGELPPERLDSFGEDLAPPRPIFPGPGAPFGPGHATEYLDPEGQAPEHLDALDPGLEDRPARGQGRGRGDFGAEEGFFPRSTLALDDEAERGLPRREQRRAPRGEATPLPPSLRVPHEPEESKPVASPPRGRRLTAADDDSRIFLQEAAARVRKGRWRRAGVAKPRASLATLLLGQSGSTRWVFCLVGAVSALVAAVGIGLAVRYFRLGEQIEAKRNQAAVRLLQGNLSDFTAAAQSYADILAQRPDDLEARWAHRRIQTAIPFEFGDPIPKQPVPETPAPKLVDFQVAQIYQQLLDGSLDEAGALLDQAQEQHPDSPLLEYLAGYVELLRGNGSAAEGHLRRASELRPTDTLIYAALGESLFSRGQGRSKEALSAYEKALALNPNHIDSVLGNARVLIAARQKLAEAERELNSIVLQQRQRLASRGQRGWAFLLLAQISQQRGQVDMAKKSISQAKSNMPINDPIFLDELAGVLIGIFQLGEAEKAVQQAKQVMRGRPHPYYRMAQILIRNGLPEAALTELDQTKSVRFPASEVLRAKINLMLGKLDEAEKQVEQALRMTGDLLEAHIVKAMVLTARGKTAEAGQSLDQLLQKYPENIMLLTARAEVYLASGKPQEARHKLDEALHLDKQSFDAQLKLAQVFIHEGDYDNAVSRLRAANKENYGNVIVLKELAQLEAVMGDLGEAATNYHEVLKRVPTDSKARLARARVLIDQRKYSEAAAEIAKAEKARADEGELALTKGLLSLRSGESRTAVALLEAAVSKQPKNLQAQGLLVQAYFLNREEGKARAAAQKLASRADGAPDGELALGRFYLNSGQPQTALAHLKRAERALGRHRRPPAVRAEVLVALGMAYQESGQLQRAEKAFDSAITACRFCPEPFYRRGLVQDEQGEVDKALESLEQAIQLEQLFIEAYFDKGQILERAGQKQRAIQAYKTYIENNPVPEMREAAQQAIRNIKRGR